MDGRDPGLIGQDESLRVALNPQRPAQALLLIGPSGSGRGRFAEIWAQAQVCTADGPEGRPCLACPECAAVAAGTHPDLHWLAAADHLGIDEIRRLRAAVSLAPARGCALVVLEHAERLTDQAAAALLKTVEDPPGPVRFLLLAEHRDQVRPTLLSRCLPLRLRPVATQDILAWLPRVRPDAAPAERERAARRCRGLPGRALALLDGDAAAQAPSAADLVAATQARGAGALVTAAAQLARADRTPQELLLLCRDACALALGALEPDGPGLSGEPEAAAALGAMTPFALGQFGWACLEAARAQEANVNGTLNWQVLLVELRRAAVSR